MQRSLKSRQRLVEILSFKVTGTGTAAINTGATEATLSDDGVGIWTLTFVKPLTRSISAIATSGTAALYCAVTALSSTAVTVRAYDAAGAATDAIFYLNVIISGASEQ